MPIARFRASCRADKVMTVPSDSDEGLLARQKEWLARELQAHLAKLAALPFEDFRLFCDVTEVPNVPPDLVEPGLPTAPAPVSLPFEGETVSEYYDRYKRERGPL